MNYYIWKSLSGSWYMSAALSLIQYYSITIHVFVVVNTPAIYASQWTKSTETKAIQRAWKFISNRGKEVWAMIKHRLNVYT